tara:strand:- start:32 stop:556 length:525 start_codon:yes stop_codon:yes gene_type:complete
METKTVNITAVPTVSSFHVPVDEIIIKGRTNVIFNFDNVAETSYQAVKLYADPGDGADVIHRDYDIIKNYIDSDLTLRIARYGKLNEVLSNLTHAYVPATSSYFTSLTATFKVTFSNFEYISFTIPIKIAQESYYTAINKLSLIETQMTDVTGNDVFAILQTKSGEAFNAVLSK